MVTNYKGLAVNNDNGYECTCSNFIGHYGIMAGLLGEQRGLLQIFLYLVLML